MSNIRRITTANVNGKSVVARDEHIAPIEIGLLPNGGFTRLYGSARPQLLAGGRSDVDLDTYFPPAGGVTATVVTLPPDSREPPPQDLDLEPLISEAEQKLPGLMSAMEPGGMHTTATIDIITLLSGRLVLELDDGVTRELAAGDVVIQNGTRHAWRNPFDAPAVMHAVSIGVPPAQ